MFVREVLQRHGCTYSLAPGDAGETRFDIWFPVGGRVDGSAVHAFKP